MTAFPKSGDTAQRRRARRLRADGRVVKAVRPVVERRDGACRLLGVRMFGPCRGPSAWAHLRGHKRSETRGQPPGERHTTAGTVMFCESHHQLEEAGKIKVLALTPRGADGPLMFTKRYGGDSGVYVEVRPHAA